MIIFDDNVLLRKPGVNSVWGTFRSNLLCIILVIANPKCPKHIHIPYSTFCSLEKYIALG